MNVIIYGASGMVGKGVLLECLADTAVTHVLSIGRNSANVTHEKLREIVRSDLGNVDGLDHELTGLDACFFCLGVSSAGMSEQEYTRITYDLTIRVAETLVRLNPQMTFCYVSGTGTDSTEQGRTMWARVKGRTENALLRMGFKAAYMFRPGYIQPRKGVKSRTLLYRIVYLVVGPLYPLLNALAPKYVTTTEKVGRAMIKVARDGCAKQLLENADINALVS